MSVRRFVLAGLCCLAAACGKVQAGGQGLNGSCARNSDCAKPFYCKGGSCVLDAETICNPGVKRCNGDAVETCSAAGDRWEIASPADNCATGCENAACKPQVCAPNARKCEGGSIFECLSNGSAWALVNACPTQCNTDNTDCADPVCAPFDTQCKSDGSNTLQTCDSKGTGWNDASCGDPSNTVCVQGRCLPKVCSATVDQSGNVTTADERCDGTVAEKCDATQAKWDTMQVCQNGCDYDQSTGTASCPAAACVPFQTQCKSGDNSTLETCNSRGTAWVDSQCDASTRVCYGGSCVPKACSNTLDSNGAIQSRQEACQGNVLVQCNDSETAFEPEQTCQYGCSTSGNAPACNPPVCNAGDLTCVGQALEKCTPDQSGYGFVQYCPSGCTATQPPSSTSASCNAPTCVPLSRQCGTLSTGQSTVQVCKSDGTGWVQTDLCPGTCAGGECVVTANTCNPGDVECVGPEVEECVRLSTGSTEWRFSERCLGQCMSGACVGPEGSAGCVGGASTTTYCGLLPANAPSGSTATAVVPLHAMLASATDQVPCDGISRVLVYSDPIKSAAGVTVPDGTMVTFSHDFPAGAPDSLLASQDADPVAPGLQRPTRNGIASVVILAPAACKDQNGNDTTRTLTVTGSLGGDAIGTTTIQFANPPPPAQGQVPTKTVYVAEDFSTTTLDDRTATTAQWNTLLSGSVAQPAFDLGTGADGDLTVDHTTVDLQAQGYARAYNVLAMGTSDVTIDSGVAPSLAPGDEVLLYSMWTRSGAGTMGDYEFKRVLEVSTGHILFTTPIENAYGNSGAFGSDQRTIVQRVPNFDNVTVTALGSSQTASVLTSSAPTNQNGYPGGGTGVLAFRAKGTVQVLGTIDMTSNGMPTAEANAAPTTTPSLSRLLEGESGSGTNGGIVFITAGTLTFDDSTGSPADASAYIAADGSGGEAGTIWVAGGNLILTTSYTRLFARAGGHVRLDYGEIDNTGSPAVAAAGTLYVGESGAFHTQSVTAYDDSASTSTPMNIVSAVLLGVAGGEGATEVVSPISAGGLSCDPTQTGCVAMPSVDVSASADNGATWGEPDAGGSDPGKIQFNLGGNTPPMASYQFKYRFLSTTLTGDPVVVQGLAFRLNLQGSL